MTTYIGPRGALVGFRCPSTLEISSQRPASYRRTLGGKVKAQYGHPAKREWQASIGSATPAQMAGLTALAEHLYGPPPWVWVDAWAQVTNLLQPAQSMPGAGNPGTWTGDAIAGGAVTLADGTRPVQSLASGGGAVTFAYTNGAHDRIPVVPGLPFTGAVYGSGSGSGTVTVGFFDAAGAGLGTSSTTYALTGTPRRLHHTVAKAPTGAATAYVRATGFATLALPSATWTADLAEWTTGKGCGLVVVEGFSESVSHAVRDEPGMRRSGVSFTVKEVG
ncbi:hypothetical protein BLJ79_04335 [Arthrobacter sp. UCD-GKA]|uniref:hypothetical protein n=1 Tax=Arthrobacter sp. UCD-GKA TaxID=1913576 RepID=UPI0008DE8181|nr:hypothetical protein [Arthrobacter sp. UCD-GKA]OIH86030.1 hypothetical protein BLJ79_04335 [Arthrobacter sp. UCD-GKA]